MQPHPSVRAATELIEYAKRAGDDAVSSATAVELATVGLDADQLRSVLRAGLALHGRPVSSVRAVPAGRRAPSGRSVRGHRSPVRQRRNRRRPCVTKSRSTARTIDAVRGIVTAATNMEGDLYSVAVEHWTACLSRDELIEVVTLLGCVLTMPAVTNRVRGLIPNVDVAL